jgi:hypothetical protein
MARQWVTRVFGSRVGVAILAGITLVTAAAIVFATVPDANKIIHGCYRNPNGDLRVIDDALETCRPNETAISWSQSGIVGYEVVSRTESVPSGVGVVAIAHCTLGKRVLGGGYHLTGDLRVNQSFPQVTGGVANSWQVSVSNSSGFTANLTAYAVCAMASP